MDSVTDSAKDEASAHPSDIYYTNTSLRQSVAPALCTDVVCVLKATALVIIVVLGITGNGLVIWIAGFKVKKTVNTVWYLSLAVSDFLYCAFLPFRIAYIVKRDWVLGLFMCKFISFNLFLNWFSSIFLLVIISVDRCVVVMFPVWAQNKRTIRKAMMIILLAWIMSALLSLPAAIFRDLNMYDTFQSCYNNYKNKDEHTAVVVIRLIFLYLIPLLIIIVCFVLMTQKLKSNQMLRTNKPIKIMAALIVAFFISWMPYHIFKLMKLNKKFRYGKSFALIFASTNSFMNPLLYAFMGKDIKRKCYALLSKIESTFEEEVQSTC